MQAAGERGESRSAPHLNELFVDDPIPGERLTASAAASRSGAEPEAYRQGVPKAEMQVLDACHFALDTTADENAVLVQTFAGDAVPAMVRRAG
jgi:hypothetical protein